MRLSVSLSVSLSVTRCHSVQPLPFVLSTCSVLVVSSSTVDCVQRLVSEMTSDLLCVEWAAQKAIVSVCAMRCVASDRPI